MLAIMLAFFGIDHRGQPGDGDCRQHELDRPCRQEHLRRQPAVQPQGRGGPRAGGARLDRRAGDQRRRNPLRADATQAGSPVEVRSVIALFRRPAYEARGPDASTLEAADGGAFVARHALRDGVWIVEIDADTGADSALSGRRGASILTNGAMNELLRSGNRACA